MKYPRRKREAYFWVVQATTSVHSSPTG